jgi:Yip1 domain
MDFKFLTDSVKNIIVDPSKAWDIIHSENRNVKYVKISLILPLILLASVSALLGSYFFINTGLTDIYSVLSGIKYLLLYYLVIYGTGLILAEITKALDLGRNFDLTFKLVAYSSIPFLICQIVSRLFESFLFINVLALFGLYVFWTGMEKMINPPEQRKLPLLIAAAVIFVVLFFSADWILSGLFDKLYFTFFA